MKCPRCNTSIVADDVHLGDRLAKCRRCNDVFRFAVSEIAPIVKQEDAWPIAKWPRPERWVIEESDGVRRIIRSWFNDAWFLWALLCMTFGGASVVLFVVALNEGQIGLAFACPGGVLLLTLLGAYGATASLVNRTVIAAGSEFLEVTHGPMPIHWYRNVRLRVGAIAQLYCTYATVYTKEASNVAIGASVNVNALLDDGSQRLILGNVPQEEGMYLEQQLEEWLGIVPARVPGQVEK